MNIETAAMHIGFQRFYSLQQESVRFSLIYSESVEMRFSSWNLSQVAVDPPAISNGVRLELHNSHT